MNSKLELHGGAISKPVQLDDIMVQAVRHARLPLCITDPTLPDNPIVYANQAFTELTGYALEEIVGRNCRFLQGPDTTPDSIETVRKILSERRVDTVEILNYRKDGTSFVNALQIGPINDENGELVYFFGSQLDISARRRKERESRELAERELLHRLRNIVNVMSAMVRMTAREESNPAVFASKVIERISALGNAHFDTIGRTDKFGIGFSALVEPILQAYAPGGASQIKIGGVDPEVPRDLISPLTLALHELATSAVKHGALSTYEGKIDLHLRIEEADVPQLCITWQERGGPEVVTPERSSGSEIIQSLTRAVGGTLTYDWQCEGLIARASFPMTELLR
ncbi:PAS domain-containing protein [Sulfitobacter aestuarii]|uniref:histidine kinase n=1 Tax=Sulfitobacter aestuarii TaxID=2161676 RepID=A0ABW5U6G5_9RHOB